jgi:hypothetical protein
MVSESAFGFRGQLDPGQLMAFQFFVEGVIVFLRSVGVKPATVEKRALQQTQAEQTLKVAPMRIEAPGQEVLNECGGVSADASRLSGCRQPWFGLCGKVHVVCALVSQVTDQRFLALSVRPCLHEIKDITGVSVIGAVDQSKSGVLGESGKEWFGVE